MGKSLGKLNYFLCLPILEIRFKVNLLFENLSIKFQITYFILTM